MYPFLRPSDIQVKLKTVEVNYRKVTHGVGRRSCNHDGDRDAMKGGEMSLRMSIR